MEKLKTATGKTYDCDFAVTIQNPPQLFLCIHNETFPTIAAVFSDSKETTQLWHEERYFSDFTKLVSLSQDGSVIQVALAKE